jgi:hypothetical protein
MDNYSPDDEEAKPKRTGVFSFTGATVEKTDDPDVVRITVSATTTPPPSNTSDGLYAGIVPPPPQYQLSVTLNNGQTFFVPPIVQPATSVQGQLIFEENISGETLPVTRTLSVASWSGGGFDELDITDTISYTIQDGDTSSIRIQVDNVNGTAVLFTSGLNINPNKLAPPLALTGGPFNDPYIALGSAEDYAAVSVYTDNVLGIVADFSFGVWVYATTPPPYQFNSVSFVETKFGARFSLNIGASGSGATIRWTVLDKVYQIPFSGSLAGRWIYCELCRSGSNLYPFIDGSLVPFLFSYSNQSTSTPINTGNLGQSQSFINMGGSGNARFMSVGQLYWLKGQALHTSNFTPPTQRY